MLVFARDLAALTAVSLFLGSLSLIAMAV